MVDIDVKYIGKKYMFLTRLDTFPNDISICMRSFLHRYLTPKKYPSLSDGHSHDVVMCCVLCSWPFRGRVKGIRAASEHFRNWPRQFFRGDTTGMIKSSVACLNLLRSCIILSTQYQTSNLHPNEVGKQLHNKVRLSYDTTNKHKTWYKRSFLFHKKMR